MNKYDAIIIGFGKGGKTLAGAMEGQGWKVAMIEQSANMYGGTCINIACIPSKSLAYQSEHAESFHRESFQNQKAYYHKAISSKDELVSSLRSKNYHKLSDKGGMTVFTGKASFESSREVKVEMQDETIILTAERIFINTGAVPIVPNIEGIGECHRVYDSTTLMEQTELPKRLVIVGGGYIGLEFASMYANFGSEVTVLDGAKEFLGREDRDIAEEILKTLEDKGIQYQSNAKVQSVKDMEGGAQVIYLLDGEHPETVQTDAILLATGRKPNTEGLHLDKAGVTLDEKGAIQVDKHLQTSVPRIWAMGDVKGGPQFTYISLDDYRIVKDQLFGDGTRNTEDRVNIPYSVFIDPPLSRVGLTEEEARKQGFQIKIAKMPVAASPRAQLMKETEGILKAVVDAETEQILGCALFCTESSEIINIAQIAMQTGQKYTFLRDHIFTHPTMSEIFNDLFEQVK
ncbi:pyridine nucleotide-disulfide oxidoreductase [Paenibacillus sp. HJL G12]|uniref:Pyridine nucleotide-disulfide oxidoreductase n=1 Tax=Paenibacillus dendrobii TaxID=2691084 RepID=A0A7X3ILT7_9BACL|nr:FAD-dependent oxidoreductase [Paenibacillus dendrobii]MWV45955.1 pyridine nucleotide-disulfide oxidoreductase [Paenibacillus dendrobii]